MTLKTENNIPNRKIRFQAYAGVIVIVIIGVLSFGNRIFEWGIEIDEAYVAEAVTGFLVFLTFVMSLIGYVTNPGEGDGIKKI